LQVDKASGKNRGRRRPGGGNDVAAPQWARETSVGYLLNTAARSARNYLDQLLAEAGATFPIWTVLAALATETEIIQRQLAQRLSIESPTLTRQLANMEASGLIQRLPLASDHRAAAIVMTPRGRALFERLETIVLQGTADSIRGFSQAEAEQFCSMLARVQDNIEAARAAHFMPQRARDGR
jgi:MarR family transcriptional regulator for hemolysin